MKSNKCVWKDGEIDKLIKYKNTTNNGKVCWKENVGRSLTCIDKYGVEHIVTIKEILRTSHILIASDGNELDIFVGSFINCQLNSLFNIITKDFKLAIGDIVDNFLILNSKKTKDKQGKEWKIYTVQCLKCKTIRDIREYDLLKGRCSCNLCSDGILFPEKFIMGILKQLNLNYERQIKFNWCLYKDYNDINKICYGLYDFVMEDVYININNIDYKVIIEADGGFHNKDNNMNGQTAEESKYIDDEKDRLALENGYYVIRIDCDYPNLESRFEFIKNNFINNIHIKTIIQLFDIINWSLVYDFTCSSLKLKCWELKNSNQELFTYDIANELGISSTTVKDYLTEGQKHGKCRYNTEKQNQMRIEKVTYINSRPIEVFKIGESKGIYFNSSDCARKSLEEFGVQFSPSHIRSVCRGDRKSHQGYTFKEISKEEYEIRIKEVGKKDKRQETIDKKKAEKKAKKRKVK